MLLLRGDSGSLIAPGRPLASGISACAALDTRGPNPNHDVYADPRAAKTAPTIGAH